MDEFTSGFPPPPFFYKNYTFKEESYAESSVCMSEQPSLPSSATDANLSDIERIMNQVVGPPCPVPPKESWFSFGVQEKYTEENKQLDSETIIKLHEECTDVRERFKLLYKDFMDSLLRYLSALKNMDPDSVSEVKRFLKLYMNLQHILSTLSERQSQDDVLRMLREQLKRRRRYIDSMKVALVDVHKMLDRATKSQHNNDTRDIKDSEP